MLYSELSMCEDENTYLEGIPWWRKGWDSMLSLPRPKLDSWLGIRSTSQMGHSGPEFLPSSPTHRTSLGTGSMTLVQHDLLYLRQVLSPLPTVLLNHGWVHPWLSPSQSMGTKFLEAPPAARLKGLCSFPNSAEPVNTSPELGQTLYNFWSLSPGVVCSSATTMAPFAGKVCTFLTCSLAPKSVTHPLGAC